MWFASGYSQMVLFVFWLLPKWERRWVKWLIKLMKPVLPAAPVRQPVRLAQLVKEILPMLFLMNV
jgi:hypothetical protein